MRAETGVKTVTAKIPITTATASGGRRKSQADTPAARVATSSWLRDSRAKVKTPPRRMANGSIFWPRSGNCSSAMPTTTEVRDGMPGRAVEQIDDIDREGQHQEGAIDHGHAQEEIARPDSGKASRTSSCRHLDRAAPSRQDCAGAVTHQHRQREARAQQRNEIEEH